MVPVPLGSSAVSGMIHLACEGELTVDSASGVDGRVVIWSI